MIQQAAMDENMVRALTENLAIIRFNKDRRVVYVNEIFANTMGYSVEEIETMQHKVFCFDSFANSPAYEQFWASLFAGHSFQDKVERKNARGETVWLEATYMPIFDERHSEVIGVCKVATDITQRQQSLSAVVHELKSTSEGLNERAEMGIGRSRELLQSVDRIAEVSDENTLSLRELQEQAGSIRGIVQTIRDIASQTNLLALNAAIEAAHAGPYGKGFHVVASEVRKLSNEVTESIAKIQETINGITKEINEISNGISRTQTSIAESQHQIGVTMEDFDEIAAYAKRLDEQARNVTENI